MKTIGSTMIGWLWLPVFLLAPTRGPLAVPSNLTTGNVLFHIQNFSFHEYGAHPENFGIAQDHRGFMYLANGEGLLEFDGVSWRLLKPLKSVMVTAVAADSTGNLFVGGMNEFGYYPPNKRNDAEFIALHERLAPEYRRFYQVRQILVTSHGVYFKSAQRWLFRWAGDALRAWRTKDVINRCFVVRDVLYAHQANVGITKLHRDSLVVIAGGEWFAQKYVMEILPHRESAMLIAVYDEGLFRYDDGQVTWFPTAADDFLRSSRTVGGVGLPSGQFALKRNSTSEHSGGVCIIDDDGRLLYGINSQAGLRDENINAIFVDREEGLWLALNNGLARIEIPAPFQFFDIKSGLKGSINTICQHQDRLYVGTSAGLFYQTLPKGRAASIFAPVKNSPFVCHDLLSAADVLLAATLGGLHVVQGTSAIPLRHTYNWPRVNVLHASLRDNNRVYLGARTGLTLAMRAGDDWQRISLLAGGDADNVLTIAQEDNGTLWLGTRGNGVFRVDCRELYPEARPFVNTIQFGEKHGLSTANEIKVFRVNHRIHVATQHGLRRFDPDRRRFVPDSSFGEVFADTTLRIGTIHQDRRGRLWIIAGKTRAEIHLGMPQANGAYVWQKYPFHRLRDVYFDTRIYSDTDGAVWFGLGENLVRYDPSVSGSCREDYEAIVRQVVAGPREEVIFGDDIEQRSIIPELSFKNNSLRFQYSAPSFEDLAAMRYQVRLEGFDNKWSNWTAEAKKEYTHLPAGSYRFRVRARNGCGEVSREGDYPFRILPPWYWRWWAFALYVLIAGAGVLGIVKARVRHLEAKTRKLAAIVAERTDTVREQAEKLQELDRLKSRFFANISHEFRTPLTLILGPLEDVIARVKDQAAGEDLRVMERNARRLLRLINQLLDLSRLESGRMTLRAGRGDFIAFLKGIVMSFASLAQQKNVALQFEGEPALADRLTAEMYFDHDKIEKVFYNLLSNALKFTQKGGKILVKVEYDGTEKEKGGKGEGESSFPHALSPFPPFSPAVRNFLKITIQDTGIGMPADRLPYIFDRFYQAAPAGVDSSHTREHSAPLDRGNLPRWTSFNENYPTGQGTGIGLALTKELVERHYGQIEAHSREGVGSEFVVHLPIGKEYFKPEEIVEEVASAQRVAISDQLAIDSEQLPVTGDRASEKGQVASETDTSIPIIQPSITPSLQLSHTPSIQAPVSDRNEVEIPMHRDDLPIILVVDDHPDVRSYIRKHLEPDFHVIEAKDGREGVDSAREAIPDLVISDVMMPKLDGYQLCEALKTNEKTSHIPVILLTAKAGEENKLAGLETGADDYLVKPFSSKELQVRAKNLIASRRKLREHFRREGLLQPHEMSVPSVEETFLQKLMQVTEQHLGEEDFDLEVLRRELNMGQKQLYRKIKALTGQTPTEFIRTIRLRRAKQLLEQHAGTISEIAFQVGFNNLSYFSKCFRDEFGQLPSELVKS